MNKFYKSSNDGICKLVKVSSDQDGNVVSEIIEVKSSESGGKLSLTNMSVSFDEFNENVIQKIREYFEDDFTISQILKVLKLTMRMKVYVILHENQTRKFIKLGTKFNLQR